MRNAIRAAFVLLPMLASPSMADPIPQSWPIIELRQYTLRSGQRDTLIELFEREFIESQEALGMKILGTFRDLDRPDRFVWIRGFRDMSSRAEGLNAFYSGPVWKAHRNAANATMLDSDDVLLLHVAPAGSGLTPGDRPRPPKGTTEIPERLVVANIYSFAAPVGAEFVDFFDHVIKPELHAAGMTVHASYVSETSPNNFPRLPVREGEHAFVWFAAFSNPSDYERCLERLTRSAAWPRVGAALQAKLKGQPEVLRLQPTPRSALPAGAGPAAAAEPGRAGGLVPSAGAGVRGAGDFDFLLGDWSVLHRRLKRRLVGETEWIEFTGPASVRKILNGLGNIDEFRIDLPEGTYTGATLRLFHPVTRAWTIYWMDSRNPKLDPPMAGRFEDGRGLFFGDDSFDGKPIRVRFIWLPMTETTCRWEQAFSVDGGATWETNWTMSLTRVGEWRLPELRSGGQHQAIRHRDHHRFLAAQRADTRLAQRSPAGKATGQIREVAEALGGLYLVLFGDGERAMAPQKR
jgi:hypothetical protein